MLMRLKYERILTSILFAVGMLTAFTIASSSQNLQPNSDAIPASLFGMHIHHAATTSFYNAAKLTPWPTAPFKTWRLWDAAVAWPNLEPRAGEWNFETLDQAVALAEKHNVEILLTLGQSPAWASSRPTDTSPYAPGWPAEPSRIEDWRRYVHTVATRYRGRIKQYEIWNEPNLESFYTGNVDQMIALTQEAYQVLKAVDSSITVVSPSPTGGDSGSLWLKEFFSKGGGNYVDVIGYHFYVTPDPPERMVPLIREVRAIASDYGLYQKPLWNTEAGWADPKPFPDELAAAYVARSYILNWATGVSRFYWYAWDNDWWISLFMVKPDQETLTPAGIAYREIQKWLEGAQMTHCNTNFEKTWICQLVRNNDYTAWIVWNSDRQLSFPVSRAWGVQQLRDLAGNAVDVSKLDSIEIGPVPLLLENR